MSINSEILHSNFQDLIELKIPALKGKGADNNRKILEIIALGGPLLKYGINKRMGGIYSTVSRRVDDLFEHGYIIKAGTRTTTRGRQSEETTYGLSWKGLIASLAVSTVRINLLQVLTENSQLQIPEREFVLPVISEIYSPEDLEILSVSFFTGFIQCTAPPLDDILDEDLKAWLMPALRAAPLHELKTKGTMNLFTLLDNPKILQYVKENYLPLIDDYEKQIFETFQLIQFFNKAAKYLATLTPEDKPSEKIVAYLENQFPEPESDEVGVD